MILKSLVLLLSIMVISCIFNSVGVMLGVYPNYPPYPMGSRVGDLSAGKTGVKRDEMNMPEIDITNAVRPNGYIYEVNDSGERSQADFPFGANY